MEDRTVTIGLIQTPVSRDLSENLRKTKDAVITAIRSGARIICLQELFRSPYFPQGECVDAAVYAEEIPGESTELFSQIAEEYHVVIIVPVFEKGTDGCYYNSAAVINTDGELMPVYRKVHVPYDPLFYEKNYFCPGNRYHVYDTVYGRIGVLICYDQWFPEAARAVALEGADIIFYPTAIGRIRGMEDPSEGDWRTAWETVQRGHAIASCVCIAAVNRTGTEGDLQFWGGSFVCDSFGNILGRCGEEDGVLVVDVDFSKNREIRESWGFLRNRRPDTYESLTGPLMPAFIAGNRSPARSRAETPQKTGYRMPAEWDRHDAVWLAWPYDEGTFPDLKSVEESYCHIITELHRDEPVNLIVRDMEMYGDVLKRLDSSGVDLTNVKLFITKYADVWFRDYGPTYVVNRTSQKRGMVHWVFNAWGEKYDNLLQDTAIPGFINKIQKHNRLFLPGIVLEGGSIDVNGKGTVLTTEQCLLNKNRNPGLSKTEIEDYLKEYLGVTNVIWLRDGITGDDTDGHVDDIARFVNENTVVCAVEENPDDENYELLQENYRILRESADQDGNPLNVITIPMPGRVGSKDRLPASYTNFYIGNGVVLVPVFGHANDSVACGILQGLFPGKKVIGINCTAMVHGLGTLHCITQQQPAV